MLSFGPKRQATTGATPANILTYTPPNSTVITATAIVTAAIEGNLGIGFSIMGVFRKSSGGTLTLIDVTSITSHGDSTTAVADLVVSSGDIGLQITGVAATDINWHAELHVIVAAVPA